MIAPQGIVIQDRELATARFEPLRGLELESAIRELKRDSTIPSVYRDEHGLDRVNIKGAVHAVLRNGDGEIKFEALYENLVLTLGNEYYGERAAGIASPPGQVTGMRLGTGTTASANPSTQQAIQTYTSGSQVAITGGYPQSQNPSGGIRRIIWAASWAAGVATATLNEAAITNESPLTNVAGDNTNTIARVILSPAVAKGASDTFDLTWNHDLGT